jgi:hypothetical protein
LFTHAIKTRIKNKKINKINKIKRKKKKKKKKKEEERRRRRIKEKKKKAHIEIIALNISNFTKS